MINCEICDTRIDTDRINSGEFSPCPQCGTRTRTDIFPAAVRKEQAGPSVRVVVDDEAGCYYHPSKKAVISCASCGRFLCELCDIEMDGKHICFPCMESGQQKNKFNDLETYRFLYDSLALWLCVLPFITVVFFWLSAVTAPIALYMTIRHWNSKGSIAPRGRRWRSVLALVLSLAQIGGWIGILVVSLG